ncbi:MAG: HAD family phosphatase [Candidatus Gastranaerophilales bacterium]|nr:HAD family phosphatase [Candidatus Gastranaerophilales bacterium]MCM1072972.1 HAD family phosphatase [Bacteroides sp.]
MQGIIFDFNGTLYWDSQLHYDAWREFSKILRGVEFTDEEMRDKMFGHTNEDIIEYAIGKKPTKEMVAKYAYEKESLYRKRCLLDPENFKLAPGAVEFLDFLKENNIPRTIATMSEWDNVEFYIKEFNLEKWFDLDKIVYSDGTIPGKPAPDIFMIAADKIGLNPKDCVVVEDAIAGINSAKGAGIGRIIAIASLEPIEFYQRIDGVESIIRDFYEFDRTMFQIKSGV